MTLLGALLGGAVMAAILVARQSRLVAANARLGAELAAARQTADDQRALLAQMPDQVRDAVATLSRDALTENRTDFLQNANALLTPVRQTLETVRSHLAAVDKAREGSFQAVTSELRSLSRAQEQLRVTTEGLSRSLRSPNVRGKWGEVQLKRIVELAGMLEQCDFFEKESVTGPEGGRQTPDLVVRLPGNSSIVVDSKVPIDAYLEATTATSEAERQSRLAAHARQVRDHVKVLGAKEYWRQFDPAPELVVMFLPLEPLLQAAFEHDGTLLEYAAGMRVVPASPMTLLAVLRAVAYGWQQQAVAKNAEEIQTIGRDLYERLATMIDHLERVGSSLQQAGENYNRFIGSLEQKVLPGARRFKELGVSSSKTIEAPDPLGLALRRVRKDELTGRGDERQVVDAESRFRSS